MRASPSTVMNYASCPTVDRTAIFSRSKNDGLFTLAANSFPFGVCLDASRSLA